MARSAAPAAADELYVPQRAISGVEGWVEFFEHIRLVGSVFTGGVKAEGETPAHSALDSAYKNGRQVL